MGRNAIEVNIWYSLNERPGTMVLLSLAGIPDIAISAVRFQYAKLVPVGDSDPGE